MAQIIEGETRKYESAATPPVAAATSAASNGSDVYVAVSNGVVNTSNPGLGPKQQPQQQHPLEKPPKVSRLVQLQHLQASSSAVAPTTAAIISQEMSDSVDAATAMVAMLTQMPPFAAAGQEAKDFNPKTYLPKKHKVCSRNFNKVDIFVM